MKSFLIFIAGLISGVLLMILISFILGLASLSSEKEIPVQYIEVQGRKGAVTLHTGMIKDSVEILCGKPDEVSLHSIGSTTYEDWGYKIKTKHGLPKDYQISDLKINFEDGKLKAVDQD